MKGGGGSRWASKGPKIKIESVRGDGVVAARCPVSGNFGETSTIEFLFDIENT